MRFLFDVVIKAAPTIRAAVQVLTLDLQQGAADRQVGLHFVAELGLDACLQLNQLALLCRSHRRLFKDLGF